MGAEAAVQLPAVVLVPFPAQGHVTPMLHLARALAVHGVAATVAVPDFIHRRIAGTKADADVSDGVALASIPSGVTDVVGADPPGFADFGHAMEHHMPAHLERLLTRVHAATGCRVACVVVDVLASWAVPVAERCGVPAAGFWPAMLASYRVVAAIPELMEKGLISESGTPRSSPNQFDDDGFGQDQMIRALKILPAQVELKDEEVPWLVGDSATQKSRFAFWLRALQRARSFRSVLVNSFPGEAGAAAAATDDDNDGHPARQSPRVLPVGPLLAGGGVSTVMEIMKCDGAVAPCKQPSMWQADSTCVSWLDRQRAGSVVYVSFGSWVGPIGQDKIRELALGLEATGRPFLWALKKDPSWRAGLPDGYAERVAVAGRGKVVDWAPQEDVLAHGSVGCYLTHCGWNSTVEAIRHGVRLLCCPVAGDQFINCAYIAGVWEIGIKLGCMSRDQVRECIDRIMDGKEGRHLQENMNVLRKKVVTAEARSLAQRNVKFFVNEINKDYPLLTQMYSIL
ncbi:UDP-glycosyltransferase 82A1 [Lolium perenne]|uniref:UDP-glycosyltransferase 82A1 n=1 Tax=Lolium perenne TaxID=4522 RepID=UPI0021E9F10E|nr:UDP-glycosyltransferase 82A1-like [Lolium perenne]